MQRKMMERSKCSLFFILILMFTLALCFISCKKEDEGSMAVSKFTFYQNGMSRYDCYNFTVLKTSEGILVTMEPFAGAKITKMAVDTAVLDRLTELVRAHKLKSWNGFDKKTSDILDGSSFFLEITFDDGQSIRAQGNNSFPKGYHEALAEINKLFLELQELYPGWRGEYSFLQVEGPVFFEYKLVIEKKDGQYTGVLDVDGYQTMTRLKADIVENGDEIELVFAEYLPDNMFETFKKGELLFALKSEGDKIFTKWQNMIPDLPLADDKRPEQWSCCFEAD